MNKAAPSTRVAVLMYHDIGESASPITVTVQRFDWQMRLLAEGGYRVIPLSQLVDALHGKGDPLPDHAVVLTFDDGFESTYTAAFPQLQRYGFPSTVFLTSEYLGLSNDWPTQPTSIPRQPLMTWAQAAEMARHGVEMGGHTLSHPRLDRLPASEAEREILRDKAAIEERFGVPVRYFAYPYGRFDTRVRDLVEQVYQAACATTLGLARPHTSDPLAIERVDAHYVAPATSRLNLTGRAFGLYLNLRRPIRQVRSALAGATWP